MAQDPSTLFEPTNRPLTVKEAILLKWMLEHGFDGANDLISQVEKLKVIAKCTCGCPSIYFAYDGVPVGGKGEKLISDHCAEVDGMPVGIMVFQTNGLLHLLEVYSLPGTDKPFGLPDIKSMLW
jgi:hypothetical protein